eukprot:maker-scaffold585_size130225-snap-gene-0.24 protein:Tk05230 transcript:maker-scaffold585_size130225-snap-gene-0.24-mRNA-1 annotation:"hypothetical protein BRAFLDRAFT_187131"
MGPNCGNDGTRSLERSCDNPPPQFGGADCLGEDTIPELCIILCKETGQVIQVVAPFGEKGYWEHCPNTFHPVGFRSKVSGGSGMTGLKFRCNDPAQTEISSTEYNGGTYPEYGSNCDQGFTQIRGNVQPDAGRLFDDRATLCIEVFCEDTQMWHKSNCDDSGTVNGFAAPEMACPTGLVICGIRTTVDESPFDNSGVGTARKKISSEPSNLCGPALCWVCGINPRLPQGDTLGIEHSLRPDVGTVPQLMCTYEHFRSGFFLKRGSKWSLKKSAIPTVFKHSGTNAKPPRETLALSCASPPNEHAKVPDGRAIVGKEHAYASWTAPKSDVSPSHSIPHFAPVAKLDPLAPPSDPLAQSDTSSCGSTGDQSEETESQRLRALQNENLTLSITIRALKEKLRQEVRKNATQRARHEEAIMTSEWRFLNSDQIRYLKNGGNRGHRWRNDTMDHAQKLRAPSSTSDRSGLSRLWMPQFRITWIEWVQEPNSPSLIQSGYS